MTNTKVTKFLLLSLLFTSTMFAQDILEVTKKGDLLKVKELLKNNPNLVKLKDQRNCTALHYAADKGYIDIVKYLVSNGANAQAKDIDGDSPLHWASFAGKTEIIKILVLKGVDVNQKNNDKETPLHTAVRQGKKAVVRLLCEAGANPNAVNNYLRSPIHFVRPENYSVEISRTLIENGADINLKNTYDETPLLYAVSMRDKGLVKLLIKNDVEIPTNRNQADTLLHNAAIGSLGELVDLLIKNGSDLSTKNKNGGTFLHSIAAGGLDKFIKLSISKGIDINKLNRYGYTPLQMAVINGKAKVIDKLISLGADKDYRNKIGESAYNLAKKLKFENVVKVLSANKADEAPAKFPQIMGKYLGQQPPGVKPKIFAPGIISTISVEHTGFLISPDEKEIYWTSFHTQPFWPRLLYMKSKNGNWSAPSIASFVGEWDTRGPSSFSADGKRLYFNSRNRPIKPDGRKVSGVWYVDRKGKEWSEPDFLWKYVDLGGESGGSVKESRDGTLYFGANRSDSKGMTDIYKVKFSNGKYEKPKNFGEPVNSKYSESAPAFSPDESYFIFGGDVRGDGIGGADLSICFRKKDGTWSKAFNMGPKVNSESHDTCPFISPDGKFLFFESHRNGNADIYWISTKIIEDLKPKSVKT